MTRVARGQIRIIGGQWRGRKLKVPDVAGLRPTPDRVRETLFNWLAPRITGARCLDAFAGSGALGFEAASRGALSVVMTEISAPALQALNEGRKLLQAENIQILRASQPAGIQKLLGEFDIVFLDPPWEKATLAMEAMTALIEQKKLSSNARVYFELPGVLGEVPSGWEVLKKSRAGEVHACLLAPKNPGVNADDDL